MCSHLLIRPLFCLTLLSIGFGAASAQPPLSPPGIGGQTATREVSAYTELEFSLLKIIQSDAEPSPNLLADDFEVWTAEANDWQSKAVWLKNQHRHAGVYAIRNLAVRFVDDIAIVSFLLDDHAAKKQHSRFITDIWRKNANILLVRYSSPAPPAVLRFKKVGP